MTQNNFFFFYVFILLILFTGNLPDLVQTHSAIVGAQTQYIPEKIKCLFCFINVFYVLMSVLIKGEGFMFCHFIVIYC